MRVDKYILSTITFQLLFANNKPDFETSLSHDSSKIKRTSHKKPEQQIII